MNIRRRTRDRSPIPLRAVGGGSGYHAVIDQRHGLAGMIVVGVA